MKFYVTKDSFFLVNVYGKTRIFFACTLYYIMFFCAERHCGRNISERISTDQGTLTHSAHRQADRLRPKNHEITHHFYGFLPNNTKKVRRMKVTFRIIS